MSLVNDMLRDLDDRRRESQGSGVKVRLTPASDFAVGKKSLVPMIVMGLLVVVLGLAAYWFLVANQPATEQLELSISSNQQFAPAQQPLPQVAESQQAGPLSAAAVSSESTSQAPVAAPAAPVASSEVTTAPVSPQPMQSEVVENPVVATAAAQIQQPQREVAAEFQPDPQQSEENRSESPAESAESSAASAGAARQPQGSVAGNDNARPDVTVAVGEQSSLTDSVKNPAQLSPLEQDILVVQEALQQIADNRQSDAYATLENHILANRYAHQSRETYAKLLMNQGMVNEANALVEGGLQLAPNHPGFKKVKARLLIGNQQVADAAALLMIRAPEVSMDSEYHDLLASSQLASGDFEGASISYRNLVRTDQGQGKWWYGFAAAQEMLGNLPTAREAYTLAMQQPNLSASLRRRSQDRLNRLGQ